MTQDEVLFQKHLSDLAGTADRRGFAVFTDFMNLNELNIFHASAQKFSYVTTKTFGGYEHAERQMAAFIPSFSMELSHCLFANPSVKQKICRKTDTPGLPGSGFKPWN